MLTFLSHMKRLMEYVGHVARMLVSEYRGCRFEPQLHYVASVGKTLYLHCFSRLSCEMSTWWDNFVKGVQCYVIFGGIALKNHAFLKIQIVCNHPVASGCLYC